MADENIKEAVDTLDKSTTILYRGGMVVTGLALFILALQ